MRAECGGLVEGPNPHPSPGRFPPPWEVCRRPRLCRQEGSEGWVHIPVEWVLRILGSGHRDWIVRRTVRPGVRGAGAEPKRAEVGSSWLLTFVQGWMVSKLVFGRCTSGVQR